MQLTVFLRDHDCGRKKRRWKEVFDAVGIEYLDGGDTYAHNDAHLYVRGTVVFLHPEDGNVDAWKEAINSGAISSDVVVVSTAQPPDEDQSRPLHACYWLPDTFHLPDPQEFSAELCKGKFRHDLLQPRSFPLDILAWRLAEHYGLGENCVSELLTRAEQEALLMINPPCSPDPTAMRELLERYCASVA